MNVYPVDTFHQLATWLTLSVHQLLKNLFFIFKKRKEGHFLRRDLNSATYAFTSPLEAIQSQVVPQFKIFTSTNESAKHEHCKNSFPESKPFF